MPMDLRQSLPATVVTTIVAVIVVARVATAPAPAPARVGSSAERQEIANRIATQEKEWLRQVGESFPQDNWSQRDDFHGREYKEVQKIAHERGLRIEDVLRAIDDDLHKHPAHGPAAPDTRAAHAVPCKPRPFYD
ncbi:MAG: hypothetical protein U0270_03475 [Labilithrix sp.]